MCGKRFIAIRLSCEQNCVMKQGEELKGGKPHTRKYLHTADKEDPKVLVFIEITYKLSLTEI